jgi:hypothetical protein
LTGVGSASGAAKTGSELVIVEAAAITGSAVPYKIEGNATGFAGDGVGAYWPP